MKNKVYCIYCGSANNIKDKKCHNCGKKLKNHDYELLKFIGGEVKDNAKDSVIDYIIGFIQNLFTNHIYGVILTLAVVVSGTSVIINNNTSDEEYVFNGSITQDKHIFSEVSDETRLLGCWRGTYQDEDDDTIFYRRFYAPDRVYTTSWYDEDKIYTLDGYYTVFDVDVTVEIQRHLYIGPSKTVEAQTFPFVWVDDNTFRYGELNEAEYRYERIDCSLIPE